MAGNAEKGPSFVKLTMPRSGLMTVTVEKLAACAERKEKQRRRVSPHWIEDQQNAP
jgi:5,10-methylenetetrahydrofolate reductase